MRSTATHDVERTLQKSASQSKNITKSLAVNEKSTTFAPCIGQLLLFNGQNNSR